ncbi:MAG: hypothetical protein IPM64_02995 [Phycisphaerales bacterium]|nr:hypothetical protein [Phycisphaerales bacterium]
MRFWLIFGAVLFALFGGLAAFAGDDAGCTAKAAAKSGECAKKCAVAKASCEVKGKKVEYDIPAMTYQVGETSTQCEKAALEAAKGDEKAVKFVVAGKNYDTKTEAMDAYAAALDSYLNSQVLTVRYAVGDECVPCPATAKEMAAKSEKKLTYRVASFTFDSQEKADAALAAAKKAVNGGCCAKGEGAAKGCCAKKGQTASASDSKGEKKECTAGEGATVAKASDEKKIGCCEKACGKVDVARGKIDAAIRALAEAAGA